MKDHDEFVKVLFGVIQPTTPTFPQRVRKNWLLVLMGIGAALAAMMLASPNAHADSNSYLARLAVAGYTGPDNLWMQTGYDVCGLESSGVPRSLIANKIVVTTGSGIYTADAYEIIAIANSELCGSSNAGFGAYAT